MALYVGTVCYYDHIILLVRNVPSRLSEVSSSCPPLDISFFRCFTIANASCLFPSIIFPAVFQMKCDQLSSFTWPWPSSNEEGSPQFEAEACTGDRGIED